MVDMQTSHCMVCSDKLLPLLGSLKTWKSWSLLLLGEHANALGVPCLLLKHEA